MIRRLLREIQKSDLDLLISEEIEETRTLDYKREVSDRVDFISDVAAMANTAGGDLIVGMAAADGIPKTYSQIVGSPDDYILSLENSIRDGIEPRLTGVEMWPVRVDDGFVLVVRIQRSWNSPHRVAKTRRFMGRNSRGNYELDISELRKAFALAEEIPQQIRAFRAHRIIKINGDETPVGLIDQPKMLLHLIPLSAFIAPDQVDVRNVDVNRELPMVYWPAERYRRNLDGMLAHATGNNPVNAVAYAQLFRNGIIEIVTTQGDISPTTELHPAWFEVEIPKRIPSYLRLLQAKGVGPPVLLFLTLIGFKGRTLEIPNNIWGEKSSPMDRDIADFPEIVLSAMTFDASVKKLLVDSVWQAFGYAESKFSSGAAP